MGGVWLAGARRVAERLRKRLLRLSDECVRLIGEGAVSANASLLG